MLKLKMLLKKIIHFWLKIILGLYLFFIDLHVVGLLSKNIICLNSIFFTYFNRIYRSLRTNLLNILYFVEKWLLIIWKCIILNKLFFLLVDSLLLFKLHFIIRRNYILYQFLWIFKLNISPFNFPLFFITFLFSILLTH